MQLRSSRSGMIILILLNIFLGAALLVSLFVSHGSLLASSSNTHQTGGCYAPPPVTTPGVGNLPSTMVNGVQTFHLIAEPVTQTLLDNVNGKTLKVQAWGYNGSTPGPTIVATTGEKVAITVTNHLPEATTVHWHGMTVPNSQDGVPGVGEPTPSIKPGESYTYSFTIVDPAGTHMYHSHTNTTKQDNLGLMGGFVIEPKGCLPQKIDRDYVLSLQSWAIPQKQTMMQAGMGEESPGKGVAQMNPVDNVTAGTFPENPDSSNFNFATINGRAYPSTSPLPVRQGERIRIRFLNISQFSHPMHMHGQYFQWVAVDGQDLPQPVTENTVLAVSGQTEDIEFVAHNPGIWPLHCHLPHHVTNNGSSGEGGMLTVIQYVH